jgi:cell wall-associated NlpC family hydrolase
VGRFGTAILARVARSGKGNRGLLVASTAPFGTAVAFVLRSRFRWWALVLGASVLALASAAVLHAGDGKRGDRSRRLNASIAAGSPAAIQDSEAAQSFPESSSSGSHKLAESPTEAAANSPAAVDTGPSPGAPSDAEVRRELRQLKRYQRRVRAGGSIGATRGGLARDPIGAPVPIADVVAGGNAIATFPYRLGGGHGSFEDNAYDCSGSVSYALAAAGFVEAPLTSGELMKWGAPGPGRWLTVYANPGHVYLTVGGLRFDTSGRPGPRGSRWQTVQRSSRGFAVRHWPGL